MATGASSPIPTTTASVTRAADDVTLTGLSVPDGCSVMFEAVSPTFVSTDARMSLSDGSTTNRLWQKYAPTTLTIQEDFAGASQYGPVGTVAAGATFKAAISSGAGNYASAINGTGNATGSGTVGSTLTQLDIGKNAGSSLRYWNNTISRIRVWRTAKSTAQLQALTT